METSSPSPAPPSSSLLPGAAGGEGAPTVATPTPGDAPETAKPVSMRGRKKHKCSVCGNIAKSRCPFHSCKGCCVKAKNPCHIHVVKSGTPGENGQSVSGTPPAHLPTSGSVTRHPHLNDSLRLRTIKPLALMTRKEAGFINYLRFQKLRNYTDSIIETEDQAFDRYMHNVSLLETIFPGDCESLQGLSAEGRLMIEGITGAQENVSLELISAGLQMRIRSNSKRKEAHKQKLRRIIDRSLQKLNKGDQADDILENEDLFMELSDIRRDIKRIKVQSAEGKERLRKMDVFNSITDKVKLIEGQEDYDSCLKLFEDNFASGDVIEKLSQTVATERNEQSSEVADKEILQEAGFNDKINVLLKGTFNKERVDSCGVVKSWWAVDSDPDGLKQLLDVPVTNLITL